MATTSLKDKIQHDVEARIKELRPSVEEFQDLTEFLTTFANKAKKPRKRVATATRRPRTGPTRAEQFAALVGSKEEGISVREAASEIGVAETYLHRLGRELVDQGRLQKDGSRYFAVAGETPGDQPDEDQDQQEQHALDPVDQF